MAQRPNGNRRSSCPYISTLAITAALFAIAALTASLLSKAAMSGTGTGNAQTASTTAAEGNMPPLDGATAWINSQPLKTADLRGKVVLVEFWTYTCINWRRQAPYVRAWADRYRDKGLVVIGVHSPEFVFEKNIENVRRATEEIRVQYPVAVDSDHAIWRAFDNEYWPALYFVDAQGRIRHHQYGEGDYEQSETVIKQLLIEAGASGIDGRLVSVTGEGPEAAANWDDLKSQENYTGYERTEHFASPSGPVRDKPHAYAIPAHLPLNHWALSGDWTTKNDASQSNDATGQLTYRFHARDLNLVMGPAVPEKPVRFRVLIDGHVPGTAHGADVDEQGYGTMLEQRMYQLIRQSKPIGELQDADASSAINFLRGNPCTPLGNLFTETSPLEFTLVETHLARRNHARTPDFGVLTYPQSSARVASYGILKDFAL
jgi:thiol-disulfide isomerase/thioredoxin